MLVRSLPARSPQRLPTPPLSPRLHLALGLLVAAALTACDSGTQPPAGPPNVDNVVRPGPASGALPEPVPVRPSGLTNASKQDKALDRTNSTSASGESRVPEPPLTDNPPPGGRPLGTANNPASSAPSRLALRQ